jgi:hypothetical protein
MKTIVRYIAGALLVAAAALGTGRPQSADHELRLSDIRAQQPQEAIFASAVCQRAREDEGHRVFRRDLIEPKTLVASLGELTKKSDEVVLAVLLGSARVLSPSGESTATYYEARAIHSWKGTHSAGEILTFGMPYGTVGCGPPGPNHSSVTVLMGEGDDWHGVDNNGRGPYAYVLFLRRSAGNETQSVQGLRLAAGEGIQGMFLIHVPVPTPSDPERYCGDALGGNVQHCDAYLESSQGAVTVPYARDPLAKKYAEMPASEFLQEVQSLAASQGSATNASSK